MRYANHEIPRTDADLVNRFFSLGDNCEFGFVQRNAGAEPLGLFRFNFTPIETLIAGLKVGFADLAYPGNLLVDLEGGEWFVRETFYQFAYHTCKTDQSLNRQRLVSEQTAYLRFQARGFLEGLENGEHIYVRRSTRTGEDEGAIRLLHKALSDIAPATLLWVSLAGEGHPPGSVEWLDDGIMHGRCARLASYDNAQFTDLGGWIALLRNAWALCYLKYSGAFPRNPTTNALQAGFGGWTGSSKATAEFEWGLPASPSGGQIMKHVLTEQCGLGTGIFGCLIRNLDPAAVYVASASVWLPDHFRGQGVGLNMHGTPRLYASGANTTKTGVWQFAWAVTRTADENPTAFPMLCAAGPAGMVLFTSDWRLEAGAIPSVNEVPAS